MLERILTSQQEVVVSQERRALRDLQALLARYEADAKDQETLEQSIRQLDELFLLVVVGEFNAGKSCFINALIGKPMLDEGVTPTTTRIQLLRYADQRQIRYEEGGIRVIGAPVAILNQVTLVDTPGTNALDREHEAITSDYVPRADLVLFVTSVDRPFTESERAFMAGIRAWGKKLVFVLNKIDILEKGQDLAEIERFVRDSAKRLLGFEPQVFPVSARQALRSKSEGTGAALLKRSRFEALEDYLTETLDEKERVRLKLLNPLGVARELAGRYLELSVQRQELLRDDFQALEDIDSQLTLFQEDMGREFRFRLSDVDNELLAFEKRGDRFFDDTLRLTRALDLLNKERVQADFERQVIADSPQRIDAKVQEIIDWMVESELQQWQSASEHLGKRRAQHAERIIGEVGSFAYNREQLLDTVGRAARSSIDSYDPRGEARRMAEKVRTAVAGAALVEVGAVGLGALFSVLATTQVADVTGILAAGTLAVLGFLILPARRRRAKRELSGKILALRRQLMDGMTEQFDREIERAAHRIQEAVAPYTRFVRAERQKISAMSEGLSETRDTLASLEEMIEGI